MQSAAAIASLPSPSAPRRLRLPDPCPPPAFATAPPSPSTSTSRPSRRTGTQRRRAKGDVAIRASSIPDNAGEDSGEAAGGGLAQTLLPGSLFGLWYLFNITNKRVLEVFHFPLTITLLQFAPGTFLVLFMWTTNLYKRPKISSLELAAILPLAVVHTMGNLFFNMSLRKVAVSFTHIQSNGTLLLSSPFCLFLGELPTIWVLLSLVLIGGVALASLTEASFNWAGFWSAMASNLTFQPHNVLSKKVMIKKEEYLDNINLFSIITVMSFFLLAPATLFVEGIKITPPYLQSAGLNLKEIYLRSLLAGLCFHAYQQVSYMILARVLSPLTHSVSNCVKRVVVIVTLFLFFRTPVSPVNALGTGVALGVVFLYSRVKRIKPKSA